MSLDELILSEIRDRGSRRETVKFRLKAPNLAVAVQRRFQEAYSKKIGEKVTIPGFLVWRRDNFFIEMPPRELMGYYPEFDQPLSLKAEFEINTNPSIGTLASFTGTIKARVNAQTENFFRNYHRRNQRILGESYIEINDWKPDYNELYLECPIQLPDIKKMIQEKLNPDPSIEMPLIFSPISAPPIFNTMGGVSSLLSGFNFKHHELTQIGKFLQNLVPSWHHKTSNRGFHIPLYRELTEKVSFELQKRTNSNLEFSPLITRINQIDLDKERGFFHLDDPLILYPHSLAFNESYKECEEFLPEIQWSIMWSHLQVKDVGEDIFTTSFHHEYEKWIEQMCEEFNFFKKLHAYDYGSLHDIRGRKGTIMRLTTSYSRINETPIDNVTINKILKISRDLFADFDNAHGFKFSEYERDPTSQYFGYSRSKRLRTFREAILDLLLSYEFITIDQAQQEAEKIGLSEKAFNQVFQEMIDKGELFDSGLEKYMATPKRDY